MRSTALSLLALTLLVPAISSAQGTLPSMEVKLTKDSVNRLLVAIPEVAAAASGGQANMLALGGNSSMGEEDLGKIQKIVKKHGFALEDFAVQVTALLHTYFTLSPKAFEEFLPSESKPAVKKILDDPKVSQADKDSLKASIAAARENKDEMRKAFAALATADNKKVVKPVMSRVHAALSKAEKASQAGSSSKARN